MVEKVSINPIRNKIFSGAGNGRELCHPSSWVVGVADAVGEDGRIWRALDSERWTASSKIGEGVDFCGRSSQVLSL